MKIYLDDNYMCHVNPSQGMTEIETDVFDGKCNEYIEACRYVPEGCSWTRNDGEIFDGLMIAYGKPHLTIDASQNAYTQAKDEELAVEAELIDTITELCEEIIG